MRRNYSRNDNQFGMKIGPFSKEMLRSTSTTRGKYIIYVVFLCSFIGIILEYLVRLPYQLTIGIIVVVLIALILNMERIINKIGERRRKSIEEHFSEKDLNG